MSAIFYLHTTETRNHHQNTEEQKKQGSHELSRSLGNVHFQCIWHLAMCIKCCANFWEVELWLGSFRATVFRNESVTHWTWRILQGNAVKRKGAHECPWQVCEQETSTMQAVQNKVQENPVTRTIRDPGHCKLLTRLSVTWQKLCCPAYKEEQLPFHGLCDASNSLPASNSELLKIKSLRTLCVVACPPTRPRFCESILKTNTGAKWSKQKYK